MTRQRKKGQQKPRVSHEPLYHYTDGPDAGKLASSYGLTPDPWQQIVLNSWLGRDEHDRFTSTSCGLAVPRQNGKNGLLEIRELYGMCINGEAFLHTAHEVKTARKAFNRLCMFFENENQYPELAEMVLSIRKTNGQEAIVLNNGGMVEFSARSRGAARGYTVDTVVFDEAQELTDEQLEAILPTLSASPLGNRQFIYTGTPPPPNAPGEVWSRMRKLGVSGEDDTMCWHEWSVEKIGDVNDRKRWYMTNPAMGIRIEEKFTATECKTMSEDGFARERLGWWSTSSSKRILNEDEWRALAIENPPTEGSVGYGIKFSIDGASVSLVACRKPEGSRPHVEWICTEPMSQGLTWLADWLSERKDKAAIVVIDGRSGTGTLIEKLKERKYPMRGVITPKAQEVATAASFLLNAIKEEKITHYDQDQLNMPATHAHRRPIGKEGAWGWGGTSEIDVTPIEAASLAYWATMTTKRVPNRKLRVG